ncbi:hypothetical protein D3C85_912550 [compost metagenome]
MAPQVALNISNPACNTPSGSVCFLLFLNLIHLGFIEPTSSFLVRDSCAGSPALLGRRLIFGQAPLAVNHPPIIIPARPLAVLARWLGNRSTIAKSGVTRPPCQGYDEPTISYPQGDPR